MRWTGYADPTWEPLRELQHTDAYEVFQASTRATAALVASMIMEEDEIPDDPFGPCCAASSLPLFAPRRARHPEYEPRSRRKGNFRPPSQHDFSVFDFTDDD